MDKLWAPWRIEYIKNVSKDTECIFCRAANGKKDKVYYVVSRNKTCFSVLNIYPYNNGHLMVSPVRHVAALDKLHKSELLDLMELVIYSQKLLTNAYNPEGFNIGINIGRAGGAGIVDHMHVHVVPRWNGDTNFMPVVSNTKIISQGLEATYKTLQKAKKKIK